jgi:hypothetical protein
MPRGTGFANDWSLQHRGDGSERHESGFGASASEPTCRGRDHEWTISTSTVRLSRRVTPRSRRFCSSLIVSRAGPGGEGRMGRGDVERHLAGTMRQDPVQGRAEDGGPMSTTGKWSVRSEM